MQRFVFQRYLVVRQAVASTGERRRSVFESRAQVKEDARSRLNLSQRLTADAGFLKWTPGQPGILWYYSWLARELRSSGELLFDK
jgi:hypothetical protein